jgi:hypothetical protein
MLDFAVCSDLYVAGRTEDGEDYTAEVYFVVAEDARGNRWRHHASFPGAGTPEYDEEGFGPYFADVRESAKAEADKLLARIVAAGGRIDLAHWSEDRPAYGSAAYQAYGAFNDWYEEQVERHAETGRI